MTFGERLKYYREKAGLNKTQLAKKMGVTAAMVRQYEKGERRSNPKHETIVKFADALGVQLSDLAPDRYPVGFDTPDENESYKAWVVRMLQEIAGTLDMERYGYIEHISAINYAIGYLIGIGWCDE